MRTVLNAVYLLWVVCLTGCGNQNNSHFPTEEVSNNANTVLHSSVSEGVPIVAVSEIPVPPGFTRLQQRQGGFGDFLRKTKVKTDDNIVNLFNGEEKSFQGAQYCILDIDVGSRDLQQCADAVMRMRAEFFYQHRAYDSIRFNFTNGETVPFSKYAEGYRASITGNRVTWSQTAASDYSYKTFRQYLNLIFTYAGSYSLANELRSKDVSSGIVPGDVIIQGGFPGHAVLVMDVAIHSTTNDRIFLLAQSYMPAQEIHILINPQDEGLSPWYSAEFGPRLHTPEWTFEDADLKKW